LRFFEQILIIEQFNQGDAVKTISSKKLPTGGSRVLVELAPGEILVPVRRDAYYQLGQPVDDVVASHILGDAVEVSWCSAEQKWVA
jgi:hypothetical protein